MRRGEILAVVGQLGSGAEVIVEALAGLHGIVAGSVEMDGDPVALGDVRQSIESGIAYVPEDRAGKGVFLDASIEVNLTASVMGRFSRFGLMRQRDERRQCESLAGMFQIDARRLSDEVSTLSGGNQQKVSVAKAAALEPRLLLLNEPTRGVDIGARSEIYATLRRMSEQGLTVIFYSTDLEEILELADRVMTIFKREKIRIAQRSEVSGDDILKDILSGRSERLLAS